MTACFRHDTSRELDPHLHTHCVVLNATFDAAENRWKAVEVKGMYRAQKFAENLYYHELCKGLRALGYEIESHAHGFEIKGVPASVVERFSKRHRQIDAETQKRIEREGLRTDVNTVRRRVARDDRKRKMKDSTADRLRTYWGGQLTGDESKALAALKPTARAAGDRADAAAVVAWADDHLFERRSVVKDYDLMSTALAHGRGQDFDLAALREAIEQRGYIREDGTHKITSRDVLRCELDIVMAARGGRRRFAALATNFAVSPTLSAEQEAAVNQILGSQDFITDRKSVV